MTNQQKPTDAELEILQILWRNGPSTVRFVNDELRKHKDVGYTTTLKLMQIMVEKGIAIRDTNARKHIYEPAMEKEETQHRLLSKLAKLAFGGSNVQLAMNALGHSQASKEEIKKLRSLLDELEDKA